MFCGNIFTSTDLQNHKKNHMKKLQKRFHRVNRALFLSLSNAFEEQKFIPKISPKKFWSAPCFPKIVCGGQCVEDMHAFFGEGRKCDKWTNGQTHIGGWVKNVTNGQTHIGGWVENVTNGQTDKRT